MLTVCTAPGGVIHQHGMFIGDTRLALEKAIELADDLVQGCPMEMGSRLFDDDWDRKYLHGEP